jgi:uncharacterized protein (DUF1015 family)
MCTEPIMRIFPFSAVRPEKSAAARVAAVPYDVVTTREAEDIIRENHASFLRVSRPDADHPGIPEIHAHARRRFDEMLEEGIFITDDAPGMYVYRVSSPAGVFTGLCCCLHVDDYESGLILRHEQTRYDKEEDRTRHIDAVNANTGPVVLLYRDDQTISRFISTLHEKVPPVADVAWHDGTRHQVYRISDPGILRRIEELFQQVPRLYIADGHHRARSAVNVANLRRASGRCTDEALRFMGVLFPHDGVRIHGYSRLVRDLGGCTAPEFRQAVGCSFRVSVHQGVDRTLFQIAPKTPVGSEHVVHMYLDRNWYECRAGPDRSSDLIESLDVSVLQKKVLEPVLGITDPRSDTRLQYLGGARPVADLEAMVDGGEYAVAFSLQPVQVGTVLSIADAGGIMPPKSTWFEPKLLSGLLVHRLG